jgi:hypothetical protein
MTFNSVAAIQKAQEDTIRVRVLMLLAIANPTELNIDAAISAGAGTGLVLPRPNYSSQGVSFQWGEYLKQLEDSVLNLQKLLVILGGPFEVRTRGI